MLGVITHHAACPKEAMTQGPAPEARDAHGIQILSRKAEAVPERPAEQA